MPSSWRARCRSSPRSRIRSGQSAGSSRAATPRTCREQVSQQAWCIRH